MANHAKQRNSGESEDYDNLELLHATYITHVFDKHYHEEYVIGVVLRSQYSFYCNGENVTAGKGQIILINPGDIHSGHAINETGWTYRALYPSISLMRQIAEEVTGGQWADALFPAVCGQ